jgi:putative transposase
MIQERDENFLSIPTLQAASSMEVSRSGYYKWMNRDEGDLSKVLEDLEIEILIEDIVTDNTGYGYRRVTRALWKYGYFPNHKRVLRIMRKKNLICKRKKYKPHTTDSNHNFRKYPNLIKDLETTEPDEVWVSDITYIQLIEEYVYLAVIMDLHTRRCVGWALSRNIDTNLTLDALHNAFETRKGKDLTGLIHHSDQGVQYASHEYVQCLLDHGILISMSSKGNAYENAFAESFIKTLKYEEVYLNEYLTFEDALENIRRFIEDVYNKKRMHSSIGYKSPIEFEKEIVLNNCT